MANVRRREISSCKLAISGIPPVSNTITAKNFTTAARLLQENYGDPAALYGGRVGETLRFHIAPMHVEGQRHRQHVCGKLRPHDPVHSEKAVEQEQHGDIEAQPAHDAEKQRLILILIRVLRLPR